MEIFASFHDYNQNCCKRVRNGGIVMKIIKLLVFQFCENWLVPCHSGEKLIHVFNQGQAGNQGWNLSGAGFSGRVKIHQQRLTLLS